MAQLWAAPAAAHYPRGLVEVTSSRDGSKHLKGQTTLCMDPRQTRAHQCQGTRKWAPVGLGFTSAQGRKT